MEGDRLSVHRYKSEDIGKMVEVTIEGVNYMDEIIGVWLPDNQYVIGARLQIAHIFARFSMVPPMLATSDAIRESMEEQA